MIFKDKLRVIAAIKDYAMKCKKKYIHSDVEAKE